VNFGTFFIDSDDVPLLFVAHIRDVPGDRLGMLGRPVPVWQLYPDRIFQPRTVRNRKVKPGHCKSSDASPAVQESTTGSAPLSFRFVQRPAAGFGVRITRSS
jgi:hypothetical protein